MYTMGDWIWIGTLSSISLFNYPRKCFFFFFIIINVGVPSKTLQFEEIQERKLMK